MRSARVRRIQVGLRLSVKRSFAALLVSCFFGEVALAQEIFVSPQGDDLKGNGSVAAPFRTIGKALGIAPAGATVTQRDGKYEESVTIDKAVTIRSFDGEWGKISGDPGTRVTAAVHVTNPTANVNLRRLDIESRGTYAILLDGGDDEPILADTRGPDIARLPAGMVALENCRVSGGASDVIHASSSNQSLSISRSEVANTRGAFSRYDASARNGIGVEGASAVQISTSRIVGVEGAAIKVAGSAVNLIERNVIEDVGEGIVTGSSTPSLDPSRPAPDALVLQKGSTVVRNNIIHDADRAGLRLAGTVSPQIVNNTIADVARLRDAAVVLEPASGNRGVGKFTADQNTSGAARILPPSVTPISNLAFRNNIVTVAPESRAPLVTVGRASLSDFYFSANLYFSKVSAQFIDDRRNVTIQYDFPKWVQTLGDKNALEASPELDAKYHLLERSPARDSGDEILEVFDDVDGDVRADSRYDRGADEFSGVPGTGDTRGRKDGEVASRPAPIGRDVVAPTISRLKAKRVGKRSAVVTWTTDEPANSHVQYKTRRISREKADSAFTLQHSVRLTNLVPGRNYTIVVRSTDEGGNVRRSRTITLK